MVYNSKYISRTGRLSCSAGEFFDFIGDLRNLGQFVPAETVTNWQSTADSCSFLVPPLGTVRMKITERIPNSKVSFSGDALNMNDFNIEVRIEANENNLTEVKIILNADLNPLLKGIASGPIERFLETLVCEMEKFEEWNTTFKESQPL